MWQSFRQNLLIAARSLAQHRRRSLLLGGAIAGVTMLLVMMLGLFGGIQRTILESATTLMTGHVNVGGFFKVTAGQASPSVTRYRDVVKVIEEQIPEVDYITTRGRGWAKVISETRSIQAGIAGVDINKERGIRRVLKLTSGNLDGLAEPRTVLLFEEQATKLGVGVNDMLTISAPTMRGVNNTIDVRVVAVAKNVGLLSSFTTFVSNSVVRELYQMNDTTTGNILVYLKNVDDMNKVDERLRVVLQQAGFELMDKDPRAFWFKFEGVNREAWTGQKLDVTTWEDEVSFIKWTLTAIQVLGDTLLFILLVIIAVGIMNTLWIAIRERTREIGTLRAIGMQRARVLSMFLTEAFLLSFVATLVGAAIGVLACAILNASHVQVPTSVQLFLMRDELHLFIEPLGVVIGAGLIILCTTGVSLIPSFLAARLRPVTAMSQVG